MHSQKIVDNIRAANPDRSPECIRRRLLKVLEELGETSEAYLSRTGSDNYKQKTWDDHREESCDTLIVMIDVALTELPTGWPPSVYLALHIEEGKTSAPNNFDAIEELKFEVARAVCSADYFLRTKDGEMGFYGAVARGVKAAAKLCYAKIPGCDTSRIDEQVYSTIERKLEKWMSRAPKIIVTPAVVKPTVVVTDVDASSYFEQIEDRQP
jgi:hypothetical protein